MRGSPAPRVSIPSWMLLTLGFILCQEGLALECSSCGEILGSVRDARSGDPLPMAQIRLDSKPAGQAEARGDFQLKGLTAGQHVLEAAHLGFQSWRSVVTIRPGESLHLDLQLLPVDLLLQDLTVMATPSSGDFHEPVVELNSAQLGLEGTLAATLKAQPGIEERGMGPATGRPVLRGLSGSRLLLTEDGAGLGDLSATSPDHAVAADPLSAGGLRVMRGPEALLDGPGAVGGVVDVERGLLPRAALGSVEGGLSLLAESATLGRGGAVNISAPVAGLDWRMDGSWRAAGDVATPQGSLDNTQLANRGFGLGVGATLGHVRLGLGGDHYRSGHGIPGGFVGAHPNGVNIQLERNSATLQLDRAFHRADAATAWARTLTWRSHLVHYQHQEREANGALGLAFDLSSHEGQAELQLDPHLGFSEGKVRLQQLWRRVATRGLSHMPTITESGLGMAWLEHLVWNARPAAAVHLTGSLRADVRAVDPIEERHSTVVGHIRGRTFAGFSGGLEAQWVPVDARLPRISLSALRGWRAPTPEELFSGGPHLAAYAFEIGNPELEPERSLSLELAAELGGNEWMGRLAAYQTQFRGFIFPSYTGRFSSRRADLYEYRYLGRDARMTGAELELDWLWQPVQVKLGASVMRATLEQGQALPAIPPAKVRVEFSHKGKWTPELVVEAAGAQHRVYQAEDPGAQPEQETAGWMRMDLALSWQGGDAVRLQQVSVRVVNVLDTVYREHLNRVRAIMPEEARSLKLMWRLWF